MIDEIFPMSLVGDDIEAFVLAVNQGIDSRLEAISLIKAQPMARLPSGSVPLYQVHEHFNEEAPIRIITTALDIEIGHDNLNILIRRLDEMAEEGDEQAEGLLQGILSVRYGVDE